MATPPLLQGSISGHPLSQLLGGAAVSSHCYQLGFTAALLLVAGIRGAQTSST